MNATLRNRIIIVLTVFAAVLMMIVMPGSAQAADLKLAGPDHYLPYRVDGEQLFIGVVTQDGHGENYYCIEAGVPVDYTISEVRTIEDSEQARRLAWLMERYRDSADKEAQAAIGMMTHDRYDLNAAMWQRHREAIVAAYPGLQSRVDALWREAADHAPASASIRQHFVQGLRSGIVDIAVSNAAGELARGVGYTVALQGPAVFDNGRSSVSGVSGAERISHPWKATGAGEVTATVVYDRQSLDHIVSRQDFVRFAGDKQTTGSAVRFSVRKDFIPTLTTAVGAKTVDAGAAISDMVETGVRGGDDHWVPGLELTATGWYFDALPSTAIDKPIPSTAQETAAEFIRRLQDSGHRPAAFGTAGFTGPGQRLEATAMTAIDGQEPYRAPDSPGFGTWVWAFERHRQSDEAKEYLLADVVSGFLETAETNTHRGRLHVQSTVTEHSATVDSELSDTITVTGFPDDHGSFAGDERYGFAADAPLAQVRVWWAGDEQDQSQDVRYRPQGAEEPQEDEHHRLIGSWDYPAKNGVIRVGAGTEDAHGNPVKIMAQRHGWYVFVWSFDGDDRVMPATSAYDDAWERTRVERFATPKMPSISTHVDPEEVDINEDFRDSATVHGDLDEGSYVEFSAFSAVEPGAEPGISEPLLDRERVELDHRRTEQTVHSATVRSPLAGLVYWKASIFNRDGDVLATHELGVKGEVVTVRPPRPPTADEPERPGLALTGSSITVVTGLAVAAIVTGAFMMMVIRRRSR